MNNPFSRLRASLTALRLFLLVPLVAAATALPAQAVTFSNFENARLVIGQADFASKDASYTQRTTPGATDVAISSTGVVAVAEKTGRIVLFDSMPTSNGAAATVVLGKPDFSSTTTGTTASLMSECNGVAFSPDGKRLIASDTQNNRVLIWNSIPTQNGQAADVVLGQSDFSAKYSGPGATQLFGPTGVLVAPTGQLVVCDRGNGRVLIWNNVPVQNCYPASVVVGQTSFGPMTQGFGPNKLTNPNHAAVTSDGRLLVVDDGNNSVRIWNTIPTSNGASANVILGQNDFSTKGMGTSQTQLFWPEGVSISPTGQLAIGDGFNDRVLIYNSVPTSNGAPADAVLGQPDFTTRNSDNGAISAQSLSFVFSVTFLPDGRLAVSLADQNRVEVFGNTTLLVTSGSLPSGQVNHNYSTQLTARQIYNQPFNWSVSAGDLPPGLDLSSDGLLSGTPQSEGTYRFTAQVEDEQGDRDARIMSIQIYAENPLVVTRTDDAMAVNDGTTLREAITFANTQPGASSITFDAGVFAAPQTITLSQGVLTIGHDLMIGGANTGGVTVSGGNTSRVFNIQSGAVSISNLTISNGKGVGNYPNNAGGGVYNRGTLQLVGCTFANNSSSNGGAIYNDVGHTATLSNCTLSGNSSDTNGGAIFNGGGTLTISNCTIVGNSTASGGGGLSGNAGTTIVRNSLIAGNNGKFGPDANATVTSQGFNLLGKADMANGFTQSSDQTGTASAPLDTKVGSLQNNGGPTPTIALLPGSPAIDAGDTTLETDQRGIARPQRGADDIGAFEYQNNAPIISSVDVIPSNPTTNATLTATVQASDADGDTLTYSYLWKKNDVVIANETASSLDLSVAGNGDKGDTISVVVTATDGTTSVSSESDAVTIQNSAPVVAGIAIDKTAPKTNDVLSFTIGTLTDADGDTLTPTYQWKKNGAALDGQTGTSLDLRVAGNGDKSDTISVVVTATDGTTSVSVESSAVTIINSAPSVTQVRFHRGNDTDFPRTLDYLYILSTISDADGDPITKSYQWSKNGQSFPPQSSDLLLLSVAGNGDHGDQLSVVISASDGSDTTTAQSDTITVLNTPPASFFADIVGGNVTDSVLSVHMTTYGSEDDDNDSLITSYVWKKNGVVLDGETGATLDLGKAGNGDKGDTISVSVTRDDGHGGVTTAQDSELIEDSPARPISVKIAPASPATNAVLQAIVVGSDPDGEVPHYRFRWTKNGNYVGSDESDTLDLGQSDFGDKGDIITVTVTQLYSYSDSPGVTDSVTVINSAPHLVPASFSGSENTPVTGQVSATDADDEALTFSVAKTTSHGTLELASDGSFNYTPASNWHGTDSFQATATDPSGATDTSTYSISLGAVNGAPTAGDDVIKGSEDVPITIPAAMLLKNDSNGELAGEADALKIIKIATRTDFPGTLRLDAARQTIVFTPRANWNGNTLFVYTIQDSQKVTASAQVNLQIAAVNDAPIAASGRLTVLSGVVGEVALTGTDVENDVLTFAVSGRPANGTAQVVKVGAGWVLRYQSKVGFVGTDTVSIIARDGKANSAPATITITVKPNNPPQLVSLTPNKGTFALGSSLIFEQKVRDADGTANLDAVALVPSASASTLVTRGGAAIWFDALNNRFTLTKDDGKTTLPPAALGQTLENSQMRVTLGVGDVIRSSNGILVLRWHITFKNAYVGTKSLWGRVEDLGGLSAGFSNLGQITLGTASRNTASEPAPSAPTS